MTLEDDHIADDPCDDITTLSDYWEQWLSYASDESDYFYS